jgi:solute carrier family 26, other
MTVLKVPQKCKSIIRACGMDSCIKNILPIVHWLPKYTWKRDLVNDTIAGCTIAVMHIPQGMPLRQTIMSYSIIDVSISGIAYATLGASPPIVGIYMAFFPVLIYFFFGTSRHNSMGTYSVICLMTGKVKRI